MTSAAAIAVVGNVEYASQEFRALPELEFTIGQYESHNPKVRACETLPGNSGQHLTEAINKFVLCPTAFSF